MSDSAMVFCRGCGKEIHESALICPYCGYVVKIDEPSNNAKSEWMSAVAFALAIFCFIGWFSHIDKTSAVGYWVFVITSTIFAGLSLYQKRGGKPFSYMSLVICGMTALILMSV